MSSELKHIHDTLPSSSSLGFALLNSLRLSSSWDEAQRVVDKLFGALKSLTPVQAFQLFSYSAFPDALVSEAKKQGNLRLLLSSERRSQLASILFRPEAVEQLHAGYLLRLLDIEPSCREVQYSVGSKLVCFLFILYTYTSVYQSVYVSIYLSMYISMYLSICSL